MHYNHHFWSWERWTPRTWKSDEEKQVYFKQANIQGYT